MKLPREFYRLPLRFDAARLEAEVAALPAAAWHSHPSDYRGNSSVRLISSRGGENDEVDGPMQPTPHLLASPYVTQVLASFGAVWGRSRLMRLGPRGSVPEHADINHHWFSRVRVHIPVRTQPEVKFFCGSQSVHMAAGEAWIFDNWRLHRVENPGDTDRIHLVADTSGSAGFWDLVSDSVNAAIAPRLVAYEPGRAVRLFTEQVTASPVMSPSEVDWLLSDLSTELDGGEADAAAVARLRRVLVGFGREWRQLWSLYGDAPEGRASYRQLIDTLRAHAAELAGGLRMRTNAVPALRVLEARVLRHAVAGEVDPVTPTGWVPPQAARAPRGRPRFERPVFVVAAPRSGSTLLFETLSSARALWTLGGEAHWLVETIDGLRPEESGTGSNRLTATHYTDAIGEHMLGLLTANVRTSTGAPWSGEPALRLLEKTPKNALRIPFLLRAFPDAQFLFLWRDPRENISSIIEGWKAGRWITYPRLPDWDGPWSFLLPPGWQALRGQPLEAIAAYQWERTNRIVLDDLAQLPRERWLALDYAELAGAARPAVERACRFIGIDVDEALAARLRAPLPLSRFTLTPPAPDKWRANAAVLEPLLPGVQETWDRLRALQSPKR